MNKRSGKFHKASCRANVEPLEPRLLLSASSVQLSLVTQPAAQAQGSPQGLSPAMIEQAYDLKNIVFTTNGQTVSANGAGETIAIVDAYGDPNITSDFETFDANFGISNDNASGQFALSVATPQGTPRTSSSWALEESLDVEWAHAIAPAASIMLVETPSDSISSLTSAAAWAASQSGVVAVSMSWGDSPEFAGETAYDQDFTTPAGHGGVTFVAASGDDGQPNYPSTSSNVLAVGGTTLNVDASGDWISESAWADSGGGTSPYEGTTKPDVAYDGDPDTGFLVYDSLYYEGEAGWQVVGGTSAGSPQWAAIIALADQGRSLRGLDSLDGPTQTIPDLYSLPSSDFNDVAGDGLTGLGSPVGEQIISALVGGGVSSAGTSATTTTSLATSLRTTKFGETVTFTATVAPGAGATGTPTGTVTFNYGDIVLGTASLSEGVATFTTNTLPVSADTIFATYNGETVSGVTYFSGSVSNSLVVPVVAASTTTRLVPSVTTAGQGQLVILTALVNSVAPGGGLPTTGTVVFTDGSAVLGSNVLNAEGATFIALKTLPLGSNSIVATYEATTDYATSASTAGTVTVRAPVDTTTALTASLPSTKYDEAVTFTATVTPTSDANGTPTGTVTFNYGDIVLGTAALNGSGVATLALSSLPVSPDTIVATYNGTPLFHGSVSSSIVEPVVAAATTTTLVPSLTTVDQGKLLILTALVNSVAPGGGLPTTGTVVFTDGSTVLGINTLNAEGATFVALTTLPPGYNSVVATYEGTTDYSASASSAKTVTVIPTIATTKTTVTSSAASAVLGAAVTVTATVSEVAPSTGTPTGTVAFIEDGAVVLGTATLNASGVASLTLSPGMYLGLHSVSAIYSGSPTAAASTSIGTLVDVTPPTLTTVASGLQSAIIQTGTGSGATDGQTVQINYTGYLSDGIIFGSTQTAGHSAISFPLGTPDVIAGLNDGLLGMKAGETILLVIPPSLGFGSTGSGVIPPDATLYMVVTLVAIQ